MSPGYSAVFRASGIAEAFFGVEPVFLIRMAMPGAGRHRPPGAPVGCFAGVLSALVGPPPARPTRSRHGARIDTARFACRAAPSPRTNFLCRLFIVGRQVEQLRPSGPLGPTPAGGPPLSPSLMRWVSFSRRLRPAFLPAGPVRVPSGTWRQRNAPTGRFAGLSGEKVVENQEVGIGISRWNCR